jgi:hypothetical protein
MNVGSIKHLISNYYKDVIVAFIVFTVAWVLLYRVINPPITIQMLTRMLKDEGSLNYEYVSYEKISPNIKVCAMASEDQNLPFHSGMDIEAIQKAINVNKKGRKVFGASTITQQVAKNVFLFPQRSFIRKGLELYFTVWMETLWTKDKILEMYLNVAEMGTWFLAWKQQLMYISESRQPNSIFVSQHPSSPYCLTHVNTRSKIRDRMYPGDKTRSLNCFTPLTATTTSGNFMSNLINPCTISVSTGSNHS